MLTSWWVGPPKAGFAPARKSIARPVPWKLRWRAFPIQPGWLIASNRNSLPRRCLALIRSALVAKPPRRIADCSSSGSTAATSLWTPLESVDAFLLAPASTMLSR